MLPYTGTRVKFLVAATRSLFREPLEPKRFGIDSWDENSMSLNKLQLSSIDVKGKRVFIRVDFNVPQDKKTGAAAQQR